MRQGGLHIAQHKGNILVHEVHLLEKVTISDDFQLIDPSLDVYLGVIEQKNIDEVVGLS